MSKKENKKGKLRINPDLEEFEIEIDSFGEIKSSFDIDKLNDFLNKTVKDKKLIHRENPQKEKQVFRQS